MPSLDHHQLTTLIISELEQGDKTREELSVLLRQRLQNAANQRELKYREMGETGLKGDRKHGPGSRTLRVTRAGVLPPARAP
jgi:hypothetical protein